MRLAATGHRPARLGKEYSYDGPYTAYIRLELRKLVEKLKPSHMISGMALGFDTIFARLALDSDIPLIAAVPFKGQDSKWFQSSRDIYYDILKHELTTVEYISEPGYSAAKMHKRDRWMVDGCDHLVAVWDGKPWGGTYGTLQYAIKKGHPYTIINPDRWQVKATVVNKKTDQYDVYIGRGSKWGNPFKDGTRTENIDKYREYINGSQSLLNHLPELKNKRLGCFCAPLPCHGDVLIELLLKYKIF